MNKKYIYYRNKRTNTIDIQYLTEALEQEEKDRKRKAFKAMYKQEQQAKEKYKEEQARGYCEVCFCLKAWNGSCNC